MTVNPIPEGYHTLTPYLSVHGAAALIDIYARAFGAVKVHGHSMPDGSILNAGLKIGTSMLMIGEAPKDRKPTPTMIYMYVVDVDAVYDRAMAAGATSIRAPADQFYGERSGAVEDPAGNQWWIATHTEDMSDDELIRRAMSRSRG